jgi:hypothetical protein
METGLQSDEDAANEKLQYHLFLLSHAKLADKEKVLVQTAQALSGSHYFSLTPAQKEQVAFFEEIQILGPIDGDRVGKMMMPPQM